MFYDDDKFEDQENKKNDQDLEDKDNSSENSADNQEKEPDVPENTDTSSEDDQSSDNEVDEYNNLENRYEGWQSTEKFYEEQRRERGDYEEKKTKDSSVSKRTSGWLVALCIMVSLIAGIGAGAIINSFGNKSDTTTVAPNVETTANSTETKEGVTTEKTTTEVTTGATLVDISTATSSGDALTPAKIFKKVSSSVVCITVKTSSGSGAGSGVVLTSDGYIVTNYHVANESSTSISVKFYDNSVYAATYVLGDEVADVALIKIEKEDCVPVEVADSEKVEMGDSVVVIGNALGNGISITSGIVSNINGTFTLDDVATPVIQVDAAINQGNSGGGLFNEYGQLIGIVNAKTGGTLVDGVGYAIPTSNVLKAIQDLQTYGYITGRARLGLVSSRGDTSSSEYLLYTNCKLYQISTITEGGSCDGTGVKVGDILYKINGQQLTTSNLKAVLAKYKVGDTVTLTILRPTADLSNYKTTFGSWIAYDYNGFLNDCEQVDISVTFVESND